MEEDKSVIQRAVVTLAEAGWIRSLPSPPTRWEVSARLFTIAHLPRSAGELRQRARSTLEAVRDQSNETVFLAIPDVGRFVVIDVAQGPHPLRAALKEGDIIPVRGSATAAAILPFLDPKSVDVMLAGATYDEGAALRAKSGQGAFAVSVDGVLTGSTSLAAPIFDDMGIPIGAIGLAGPTSRIPEDRHAHLGTLLLSGARNLSQSASA
ncbi:IclR family transcriptional regulator [Sphingobium tyrosinilyticum]|uniref:IclR family transcriptional regulator n=1 Tax=Sphingobium tyrosinilyticum TaxID=2715436 RepID=A0ABV9EY52_9SPHN